MNNQNRKSILILLIIQTIITIVYGFCLVSMVLVKLRNNEIQGFVDTLIHFLPEFIILISSLAPQFVLILKHKIHSQDGEILPLLFTVTSLQASFIIVDATRAFGYLFLYPELLLVVERFSILGSAALMLISALRYYGYSSSNISYYTASFLGACFILSCIVPMSSIHGKMTITTSSYEIYIQIAIVAMYLATIITFMITAIKDKTSLNVKRSIAFIAMAIGLYLSLFGNLYTAIAATLLYLPGAIILVRNAGDSL